MFNATLIIVLPIIVLVVEDIKIDEMKWNDKLSTL